MNIATASSSAIRRASAGMRAFLPSAGGADGVRLYFNRGKGLPDPEKLLQGSGGQTRWIHVEGASTLARPAVASLIDEAIARNRVPFAHRPRVGGRSCGIAASAASPRLTMMDWRSGSADSNPSWFGGGLLGAKEAATGLITPASASFPCASSLAWIPTEAKPANRILSLTCIDLCTFCHRAVALQDAFRQALSRREPIQEVMRPLTGFDLGYRIRARFHHGCYELLPLFA